MGIIYGLNPQSEGPDINKQKNKRLDMCASMNGANTVGKHFKN